MTLRNTEYRISFSSKAGRFYSYFARDGSGWYQITAAGNRHKATAEQVLNHILPALAKVKAGRERHRRVCAGRHRTGLLNG